jgi:penicillin-binding protein 1A
MAASKGGPVAIEKGLDSDEEGAEPVPDKTGATGVNESIRDQVISPATAEAASSTLATVVTSGTGKRAQTGEPTWGKTGTTDDNGDAWFCGATPDITACVWVGHAESRESMLTEFGGAPVDGGTIPALIFADVVNAYLAINEEEAETPVPAPIVEEAPVIPEEVPVEPAVPVEPEVVPEEVPVEPEPEPEVEEDPEAGIAPRLRP